MDLLAFFCVILNIKLLYLQQNNKINLSNKQIFSNLNEHKIYGNKNSNS
jgi:hypothetical protein